jgi:hypothetical protein
MIRFTESDMAFAFEEDKTCNLERSLRYQALKQYAVSSVECVTLYQFRGEEHIVFIEAKKSAPNPNHVENHERLGEYMNGLKEKYEHSIHLCYSALHGIDQERLEIGGRLLNALNCPRKIMFLLIVKRLEDKWCQEIQAVLQKELKHLRHIWQANVLVINEALAKKYHIVV